jgi:hypothetical protein
MTDISYDLTIKEWEYSNGKWIISGEDDIMNYVEIVNGEVKKAEKEYVIAEMGKIERYIHKHGLHFEDVRNMMNRYDALERKL